MSSAPPVGWVRLSTTDPPMRVLARLSKDPPKVEAGYGGWMEVARPRRSPLTTWQASPGLRIQVGILLDNYAAGISVEKQIAGIQLMGRPSASNGQPPLVKIEAPGGHIPYQSRKWVLDTIDQQDAIMNAKGDRTRQDLLLHFLEYVEDVYLQETSAANRERVKAAKAKGNSRGASKKRNTSKSGPPSSHPAPHAAAAKTGLTTSFPFGSGESLVRVAARELGDCTRWPEIAALNNLRDPRAVPYGLVIRLP